MGLGVRGLGLSCVTLVNGSPYFVDPAPHLIALATAESCEPL